MVINSQTKIAALLKQHPDALEAIVTLSPDFQKLRNPILRRLMAGRTTISMASKIGGCSPEDFFRVLKPYGFESDSLVPDMSELQPENKELPRFMQNIQTENLISLDVRVVLAQENDPLKLIQQTASNLLENQILKIINSFEPTPLIKLLEKQGFDSYTDFVQPNLVETYFHKVESKGVLAEVARTVESDDWDQKLKFYRNKLQEIDVRNLEVPAPRLAILDALKTLSEDTALFVYHKRIPVYLLTDLHEQNFDYRINNISDGDVQLLIFKNSLQD